MDRGLIPAPLASPTAVRYHDHSSCDTSLEGGMLHGLAVVFRTGQACRGSSMFTARLGTGFRSMSRLGILILAAIGLSCNDRPTIIETHPPTLTGASATGITSKSAFVICTLVPNADSCTFQVEYGRTLPYTMKSLARKYAGGSGEVAAAETLNGLLASTTYHWRLVAINENGTTTTTDTTFATLLPQPTLPPEVTTLGAVTSGSQVTFKGIVHPHGLPTLWYFEYDDGSHLAITGSPTMPDNEYASIVGISTYIASNVMYRYRIVASNENGMAYGDYMIFSTPGNPPTTPRQYRPLVLSTSKAWMMGNSYDADSTRVEYGATPQYGLTTPASPGGNADVMLSNLTPGTYHWRIVAWNKWGVIVGPDSIFTLPASVVPMNFPLKAGVRWTYSYHHANEEPHGTHTWIVKGSDDPGVWLCTDVRADSFLNEQRNYDSVAFYIRDLPDYYQVEFPEWLGFRALSRRVPKWVEAGTDTLKNTNYLSGPVDGFENTWVVSGVGIVSYSAKGPYMYTDFSFLKLREYHVPQ
jgi:hypothetical protein